MQPDPEMRRAALPGSPEFASQKFNSSEASETAREPQARFLRQRFALGYYFATTVAPLIWGLPR
jgi:hypothetical protein